MKNFSSFSASENRKIFLRSSSPEFMDRLNGMTRTKESTIGAAGNIVGGVGQMITGRDGRINGALRVGQGVLDAFDTIPSAGADMIRSVSGMPTGNEPPTRFNVTRALFDARNIRTDDPVHTINDGMSWTAGMIHALVFKGSSDLLKLARGNN